MVASKTVFRTYLSELKAEDLHKLRIAVKRLRYAADFLLPAFEATAATAYIDATESLQNALGTLNDRIVGAKVLADIARASRSSDGARRPCKRLGKHLKGSGRHDRRNLKQAWRAFKKAVPFWRGLPNGRPGNGAQGVLVGRSAKAAGEGGE